MFVRFIHNLFTSNIQFPQTKVRAEVVSMNKTGNNHEIFFLAELSYDPVMPCL